MHTGFRTVLIMTSNYDYDYDYEYDVGIPKS